MARETIGMTAEEMLAYLDELLQQEAADAAAANGTTVDEELASPGFAAMRASGSSTPSKRPTDRPNCLRMRA